MARQASSRGLRCHDLAPRSCPPIEILPAAPFGILEKPVLWSSWSYLLRHPCQGPSPASRARDFRKKLIRGHCLLFQFRRNGIADLEAPEAARQLVKPDIDHRRGIEREHL